MAILSVDSNNNPLNGTNSNDILSGDGRANVLNGGGGDDTIRTDVAIDAEKFYNLVQIQDGTIADLKQKISSDPNFTPTNILQAFGTSSAIKFAETAAKDGYQVSINNDELVLNVTRLTSTPTPPIGSKSQGLAQGRSLDLTIEIDRAKFRVLALRRES